jgi:hypothetical protein
VVRDLRLALTWVWLLVSALLPLAVIAAVLLPEHTLLSASLALQTAHDDGPCALCGMTRAIVALARGDFSAALAHYRWSVFALCVAVASCTWAAVQLARRACNVARENQGLHPADVDPAGEGTERHART